MSLRPASAHVVHSLQAAPGMFGFLTVNTGAGAAQCWSLPRLLRQSRELTRRSRLCTPTRRHRGVWIIAGTCCMDGADRCRDVSSVAARGRFDERSSCSSDAQITPMPSRSIEHGDGVARAPSSGPRVRRRPVNSASSRSSMSAAGRPPKSCTRGPPEASPPLAIVVNLDEISRRRRLISSRRRDIS